MQPGHNRTRESVMLRRLVHKGALILNSYIELALAKQQNSKLCPLQIKLIKAYQGGQSALLLSVHLNDMDAKMEWIVDHHKFKYHINTSV